MSSLFFIRTETLKATKIKYVLYYVTGVKMLYSQKETFEDIWNSHPKKLKLSLVVDVQED